MNKTYELTVLLPGSLTPEEVKATLTALKKAVAARQGTVEKEESWGKKTLAYLIKKQTDAQYFYFEVTLPTSTAQEFERDVRLTDHVLRELFVIKGE